MDATTTPEDNVAVELESLPISKRTVHFLQYVQDRVTRSSIYLLFFDSKEFSEDEMRGARKWYRQENLKQLQQDNEAIAKRLGGLDGDSTAQEAFRRDLYDEMSRLGYTFDASLDEREHQDHIAGFDQRQAVVPDQSRLAALRKETLTKIGEWLKSNGLEPEDDIPLKYEPGVATGLPLDQKVFRLVGSWYAVTERGRTFTVEEDDAGWGGLFPSGDKATMEARPVDPDCYAVGTLGWWLHGSVDSSNGNRGEEVAGELCSEVLPPSDSLTDEENLVETDFTDPQSDSE